MLIAKLYKLLSGNLSNVEIYIINCFEVGTNVTYTLFSNLILPIILSGLKSDLYE